MQKLKEFASIIDARLPHFMPGEDILHQAMRYSVLSGGKRVRPFLLCNWASFYSDMVASSLDAACAVEILHCYSLIHDDLPALDNDDVRRGMPTLHKKFNEAVAILTGDALLTLSFEILSSLDLQEILVKNDILVKILSQAAGHSGMVLGQMLDIEAACLDIDSMKKMHHLKTGKLFIAACWIGAIIGGMNERQIELARTYGAKFGAIFQLKDDLGDLDSGEVSNMLNYVKKAEILQQISQLKLQATEALQSVGEGGRPLYDLLDFITTV